MSMQSLESKICIKNKALLWYEILSLIAEEAHTLTIKEQAGTGILLILEHLNLKHLKTKKKEE